MHNRYGMDVLGKHMMNFTLVLLIVNIFVQSIILQVLTLTLLIVANYRVFSKKRYKRASENRFYLQYIRKVKFKINKLKARKEYKYFNWFIDTAKKEGCKVHALGFTNLAGLKKYPFYSVDSTSWLSGNRFGGIYSFTGDGLIKHDKPPNTRMKQNETAWHNFSQWIKFQKYADVNF